MHIPTQVDPRRVNTGRVDPSHTLRRLRLLLHRVGQHGGAITPSVYETAQVLRFCPQLVDAEDVVNWLLAMQQQDGGWEQTDAPLYRTVPTLAAVLALREQGRTVQARRAWEAGWRYLTSQTEVIGAASGLYLPVAIELILPRLLDEAAASGLHLARGRFQHIEELNRQRLALIARMAPAPDSPPIFSWEAWGREAHPDLVGAIGGVGHSPAATAWWLHLDAGHAAGRKARARCRSYLMEASRAGCSGVRGVVPGPWPMNRFEQSFVLHMIVLGGLAQQCELAALLEEQASDLQRHLATRGGVGFSDGFAVDGDDTAAAVHVATALGLDADETVLAPFQREDHFVAYPFELHMALSVTARGAQAMAARGRDVASLRKCIVQAQQAEGWWSSEKWNRSPLYGTLLALSALGKSAGAAKIKSAEAFLHKQQGNGGWGCFGHATAVETAYAVLALCRIVRDIGDESGWERECVEAIARGQQYLHELDRRRAVEKERLWISKDLYSARRVDQATILCALAAPALLPGAGRPQPRRRKAANARQVKPEVRQ